MERAARRKERWRDFRRLKPMKEEERGRLWEDRSREEGSLSGVRLVMRSKGISKRTKDRKERGRKEYKHQIQALPIISGRRQIPANCIPVSSCIHPFKSTHYSILDRHFLSAAWSDQ
jgi:hypothetical protein